MIERSCKSALVLDNEPAILTLMRYLLQQLGYEVLLAETPEEAMSGLVSTGVPSIIFSDIELSAGKSGIAFREAVLAQFPSARVILMSGNICSPVDGAFFLSKPFSLASVSEVIDKINSTAELKILQ